MPRADSGDKKTGKKRKTIVREPGFAPLAVSANGRCVASDGYVLRVYDIVTGRLVGELGERWEGTMVCTKDGQAAFVWKAGHAVRLRDLHTGKGLGRIDSASSDDIPVEDGPGGGTGKVGDRNPVMNGAGKSGGFFSG